MLGRRPLYPAVRAVACHCLAARTCDGLLPAVGRCMRERGYTTYNDIMQAFVSDTDPIVEAEGKTVIHWDDVFDEGIKVSSQTVYQVWTSHSVLPKVLQAGYRAILSNSNAWYLNCGASHLTHLPS